MARRAFEQLGDSTIGRYVLLAVVLCTVSHGVGAQDERPNLVVELGHSSVVTAMAFSPDDRFVVTGTNHGTVHLWSVTSGEELRRFEPHCEDPCPVLSLMFSRTGESVYAGHGAFERAVRVWSVQTGEEMRRFGLQKSKYPIKSIMFSRDLRHVLTGSHQGRRVRVWSVETQSQVREFPGRFGAISPDGKYVVTGDWNEPPQLWRLDTGLKVWRFGSGKDLVAPVTFSPDGQHVLTGNWLWSVPSGQLVSKLGTHPVMSAAFSPDGRYLLTGSKDRTRLLSAKTGKEILHFQAPKASLVAFSSDGRYALTARDRSVVLRSVATGEARRQFEQRVSLTRRIVYSPDGRHVAMGDGDGTAHLWSLESGKEIHRLEGHDTSITALAFSPNGKYLVSGAFNDGTARLWSVESGTQIGRFEGMRWVHAAAFSPDGRFLLIGSFDRMARLWSVATGEEVQRFEGHTDAVSLSVAFSPDGRTVFTHSQDGTARLWSVESGQELQRFPALSAAFSPDGLHVLTGSTEGTVRLWSAETGREMHRLGPHDRRWVIPLAFSPDGQWVLTGAHAGSARMWSVATGKEVRRFPANANTVSRVFFSPDGRLVLTGSTWNDTAWLWSVDTGRTIERFERVELESVAFSPEGEHLLMGGLDGAVRMVKVASGRQLSQLVSFRNGKWTVVDAEGRFDAPDGGEVEGLHWRVGSETIALYQLKERYFEPHLLAKLLGHHREPLRDIQSFNERGVALYPEIQVTHRPVPNDPRLGLRLLNRGGGIGPTAVLVNGKELTADIRPVGTNQDAAHVDIALDLGQSALLVPGQDNTIEIRAYNGERYLLSRGVRVVYHPPAHPQPHRPTLWAIVVGVSDYRGTDLDLRFAAKDAETFAAALRLGAERLFGPDRVKIMLLADESRSAIVTALEQAQRAHPTDLLVIYLSGHGISHGGPDGDFYYLTREALTANLDDPAVRETTTISSRELIDSIKRIPALKQVLILDTCSAGRLVKHLGARRNISSNQMRALQRMKDRTGMYVLAGASADAVSYEASRFGQGLLTYSLLFGMRGAALREGEFVDVSRLFAHAVDQVPVLARGIGGIQRPLVAVPTGAASFDIGQIKPEDAPFIRIELERPLVLRSRFEEQTIPRDTAQLTKRVDEALRKVAASGDAATFVFVDATEFPGAYVLAGRYHIEGTRLVVSVYLLRGDELLEEYELTGHEAELHALAARIVEEAKKRIAAH